MKKVKKICLIILFLRVFIPTMSTTLKFGEYPSDTKRKYRVETKFDIKDDKNKIDKDSFQLNIEGEVLELNKKKIKFDNYTVSGESSDKKIQVTLQGDLSINDVECIRDDTNLISAKKNTYIYAKDITYSYIEDNVKKTKTMTLEFYFNKGKKSAPLEIKCTKDLNLGVEPQGGKFTSNSQNYSSGEVVVRGDYRAFVKIEYDDKVTISNKRSKIKVDLIKTDSSTETVLYKNKRENKCEQDIGEGTFYIDGEANISNNNAPGDYKGNIRVSVYYE